MLDGGEGDVDCGYYCPNRCVVGQTCGGPLQCQSNDCKSGYCANPPANKTCIDWYNAGSHIDGPYTGYVDYTEQAIYCDMTNGGWMLAFEKESAMCAEPTLNVLSSYPNADASSHVGDRWANEYALAQYAPEARSLPTWSSPGCALLSMYLRGSVTAPTAPAPAYTEIRFTAYENGALTWFSYAIPRTSLLVDWGVDGTVLNGNSTPYYWCRGSKAYTATGACKGSTGLGDGWDFSSSYGTPNDGLTMAELFENGSWNINNGSKVYYFDNSFEYTPPVSAGQPGANQAIWIR